MDHRPAAGPAGADRLSGAAEPVEPEQLAELIAREARRHQGLLLCTDFDGSIAPLRTHPDEARALPAAERALTWMSRRGATSGRDARCPTRVAVISARDSDDVAGRVVLGPEAV